MRSTHIIPYAFELQPTLEGKISGGLPAVFAAEIEVNRVRHDRILRILSTDKQSMNLPDANAEVIAADASPLSPPFGEWFGNNWAILHTAAHTSATCTEETLHGMFRGNYHHPLGSMEQLVEHTDTYSAAPEKIPAFAARYRKYMQLLLSQKPPKEQPVCINWQDPHLFFTEVVKEHASNLAANGYVNTGHLHTSIPPPEMASLSKWWNATLQALSVFRSLYVHTEQGRSSLETQIAAICERVQRAVPQIKLFNLGPDHILIDRFLAESSNGAWEKHVHIGSMDKAQYELMRELVQTKDRGLHRFLIADRSDPGKGLITYLDAVRVFLEEMPEAERKNYRFFGIHDLIDLPPTDPYDVKQQYIGLVQERYTRLQRDFPGIVFSCKSIAKEALLFAADQDCYPVTAAADDGLNLVGQEMTKINAQRGRSRPTIFARGAGFTK